MKAPILWKNMLAMLAIVAFATPCLGYDLKIRDAPNWVNDGSIYTVVKGKRYFYGVGSSPVVGDPELQQAIAKSRAKNEASRLLSGWMEEMVDDYRKSEAFMDDTGLQKQIKALDEATMAKATLAARWKDPRTGSLYSLMLFDMDAVRHAAANEQIDAALREHIRKHGNVIFDSVLRHTR